MTSTLTIRIDDALKSDAEELFEDLGLTLTTAITCFFKKALAVEALPFTVGRRIEPRGAYLARCLAEAKAVANDPSAPTCTDPDKLEEFLLA